MKLFPAVALIMLVVLCHGVLGSYLVYDEVLVSNYTIPVSKTILYNYSCPNASNSSQHQVLLTVNLSASCSSTKVIEGNVTLSYEEGYLEGDGFKVFLDNHNTTQTLAIRNITKDYIILRFYSSYVVPEPMQVNLYDEEFTYNVVGTLDLFVPMAINYSRLNYSTIRNGSLPLVLYYNISGRGVAGNLTASYTYKQPLEISLVKEFGQYKVNDLIIEKLLVDSKIPIRNITVNSSKDAELRIIKSANQVYVYVTPHKVGDYKLNYTLVDYFGNSRSIISELQVAPLGTVYFPTMNIPSIAVGERTKIKLYEHDAVVPINFTLVMLQFEPDNYTYMYELNKTPEEMVDVYLSDDNDNNYFTVINRTATVNKNAIYLNIMPLAKGNLVLRYLVATPEEMNSNDDFIVRALVSNYSIFATQEFNVGGVMVTCELSDPTNLAVANRRCWTEFPMYGNLDNNLIILNKRDFDNYEQSHKYQLQLLEDTKNQTIRKRENWLMIFIGLFVLVTIAAVYLAIPKGWLAVRIKQEK